MSFVFLLYFFSWSLSLRIYHNFWTFQSTNSLNCWFYCMFVFYFTGFCSCLGYFLPSPFFGLLSYSFPNFLGWLLSWLILSLFNFFRSMHVRVKFPSKHCFTVSCKLWYTVFSLFLLQNTFSFALCFLYNLY